MDVWLLAKPIHNFLYNSSVFLSFVYVGLKLRNFSAERNRLLLLVAVAGSFFLYESYKSLVSLIIDALNHPDLITWLENWESADHKVSSYVLCIHDQSGFRVVSKIIFDVTSLRYCSRLLSESALENETTATQARV